MEKNQYFGQHMSHTNGEKFEIQPFHVLWPIPQPVIDANTQGVINQNYGYDGYDNNIPSLDAIQPEEQDEF